MFEVDPVRVCKGRCPLLGWFSPTCTFFSRAKGDPLDEEAIKVRGLCWVATRWAASKVRPRVLCMENVIEFQKFGPLHKEHSHGCSTKWAKRHAKLQKSTGKMKPCCMKRCQFMKPIKEREGSIYRAFLKKLRRYYKYVETKVMTACDYGAPTSRKRWFLIASDFPIAFPEPTHGPGRAHPYRTAAECIDWTIPCPSIFERDRPLKDKTLARIVAGAHKFVLDAAKPFIVPAAYGRDVDRTRDVDGVFPTICGNRGGHGVVVPYVVPNNNNNVPRGADQPCPVITTGNRNFLATLLVMRAKTYGGGGNDAKPANTPLTTITRSKRGEHCVAAPYLVHRSNGERRELTRDDGTVIAGQQPRCYDVTKPIGTLMAGGIKHGLTVPVLIKNNGGTNDQRGGGTVAQGVDEPKHTIATHNTTALAMLYGVKARGTSEAHVNASGYSVEDPLTTISGGGDKGGVHHGVVAASVVRYNGQRDGEARGQSMDEPISTVDTSNRFALQTAYLVRYNGTGDAESVGKPVGTLTTKERFGLTTISLSRELTDKAIRVAKFLGYDAPLVLVLDGDEWVLADIGFRMLTPRELYRCQGFPDTYVIDPMFRGKPLSKTAQIKGVGNSVPPIMAQVIGRAALAPMFEMAQPRAAA